jgi:hypothetical protein
MDCTDMTVTLSDGCHRPCNAITTSDFIFLSRTAGAFVNPNWVIENKLALVEKWRETAFRGHKEHATSASLLGVLIIEAVFFVRRKPSVRLYVCMFVCLQRKSKPQEQTVM